VEIVPKSLPVLTFRLGKFSKTGSGRGGGEGESGLV